MSVAQRACLLFALACAFRAGVRFEKFAAETEIDDAMAGTISVLLVVVALIGAFK